MKVSYEWLKELSGVDWPVEEMADRLTMCGTACEDIVSTSKYMQKVVVGEVLDVPGVLRRAVVGLVLEADHVAGVHPVELASFHGCPRSRPYC